MSGNTSDNPQPIFSAGYVGHSPEVGRAGIVGYNGRARRPGGAAAKAGFVMGRLCRGRSDHVDDARRETAAVELRDEGERTVTLNDTPVVVETEMPGYPLRRGKVRDIYDLGDEILLVATDRISAYDVVLPTAIPRKGEMLTRISEFWFNRFADTVPHHLIEVVRDQPPADLAPFIDQLRERTMRCRKTKVVPIECVVRGYLTGSGWKDYCTSGAVCGIALPPGLKQCEQLPEPIFTPATKAEEGHDENISIELAAEQVGADVMDRLRSRSLDLYTRAAEYARTRGIIIADTKFEFGLLDGEYLLIDEVLTPDSSRFWPADQYEPGRDQDSFDKQYVRNYLTTLVDGGQWDKTAPGPELPDDIVANTAAKYAQALDMLIA